MESSASFERRLSSPRDFLGHCIFSMFAPFACLTSEINSALAMAPFSTTPGPRGSSISASAFRMDSKRLLICAPVERATGKFPRVQSSVTR